MEAMITILIKEMNHENAAKSRRLFGSKVLQRWSSEKKRKSCVHLRLNLDNDGMRAEGNERKF